MESPIYKIIYQHQYTLNPEMENPRHSPTSDYLLYSKSLIKKEIKRRKRSYFEDFSHKNLKYNKIYFNL